MRLPFVQDLLGLGQRLGRPNHEQTMVQGQLDQVGDDRSIMEHERAMRLMGHTVQPVCCHCSSYSISHHERVRPMVSPRSTPIHQFIEGGAEFVDVSFTYQTINIAWIDPSVTTQGDWAAPSV